MRFSTLVLLASLMLGISASGAYAEDAEMSLDLYKKIKGHFDALYGANVALLPGVKPLDRAAADKELRADVSANKADLIKALGAGKPLHRELAARALEYCDDKAAAVAALCKTLEADADESVRRASAAALAKLPDAAAVDPLIKALGDSADSVRGLVATALGNVKDNRATEPLLRMLGSDAKPMNRMQAATALSKIKDPASLEKLQKLLQAEKDERVKMAIAGAMRSVMGGNNAATEQVPTADGAAAELAALAKEMKEVEEKLRNDRHDQAVQVQGGGIEQKLAMLIEKLDKG